MSSARPAEHGLGEEALDLLGHRVLHGRGQQLGLARVAAVDGPGGEPGPAGDLGDAGTVVALLGEDLGGRGHEAPGRVVGDPAAGRRRRRRSRSRSRTERESVQPRRNNNRHYPLVNGTTVDGRRGAAGPRRTRRWPTTDAARTTVRRHPRRQPPPPRRRSALGHLTARRPSTWPSSPASTPASTPWRCSASGRATPRSSATPAARVTDDVLRSLALVTALLGVERDRRDPAHRLRAGQGRRRRAARRRGRRHAAATRRAGSPWPSPTSCRRCRPTWHGCALHPLIGDQRRRRRLRLRRATPASCGPPLDAACRRPVSGRRQARPATTSGRGPCG